MLIAPKNKMATADNYKNYTHHKYRPDIDGLRAIAVLSVVAFHAFPQIVTGGFIGVDVFFVISGFLISTIIYNGLENSTFSFIDFYGRRIRRIFPALSLVLISCIIIGWFVLFPNEYNQLGKHIAGGSAFISNFILWNESGYFDNDADTKPLLHLWSLGIEEQFYIFWPLLLWCTHKLRLCLLKITIIVFIASFSYNIYAHNTDVIGDFFSPQTRFWELLTGSLLGYITLHKPNILSYKSKYYSPSLLAIAGVILIIIGISYITKVLLFPGYLALFPVIGTAMIIAAGKDSWLNRIILSSPIFVWFGLISFPLYLWHWPLLTFARIILDEKPDYVLASIIVIISVILAWITYRFIERPIRFGSNSRIKTLALLIIVISIGAAGYCLYKSDGFPSRSYAKIIYNGDAGHSEFFKYMDNKFFPCTEKSPDFAPDLRCMQSKNNPEKDIAIVGDSHAEHLFIGFADNLADRNIVYYQSPKVPFIDNPSYTNIYKTIITSPTIKKVIITMHWAKATSQVPTGSTLENEILKTADTLIKSGKEVYLTDGNPTFRFSVNNCRGKRLFANSQQCSIDKKSIESDDSIHMSALHNVVKSDPRIKLLETNKYLCNETMCSMVDGNNLLYRDNHHLNILGSKFIGEKIIQEYPDIK